MLAWAVAQAAGKHASSQPGVLTCMRSLAKRAAADNPLGPPAFVFDIDGVLIRGKTVLPAAQRAMQKLTHSDGSWRYPVCFLTNGGGVSEERKAQQLSEWLGVRATASQVILGHTPMRQLVPELGNRPVLVSGRGDVLQVARSYGFTKAIHARDLGRAVPAATPFSRYAPSDPTAPAAPCPVRDGGIGTERHPLAAVLVFTDPDDWYRDAQLICDVLTGHGVLTRSATHETNEPMPGLYFSHPDFLWANEFPKNRFGQGAFQLMVMTLYNELTDRDRPAVVHTFGKPNAVVYRLAEQLLLEQAKELGLVSPHSAGPDSSTSGSALPFSGIYAVGDNPAADVRGANGAGLPWVSCLVRTGVFKGPGANCTKDTAALAVEDVDAAVTAVLHRTRSARWHSLR